MTRDEILNAVRNGSLYGFVECNIKVPDNLRYHFADNPPIVKNIELSSEHLGDRMADYGRAHSHLSPPHRSLIGSLKGEKMLLLTDLQAWYLEHGLVVTKINQVVEYKVGTPFIRFGESVSAVRRQGDIDLCSPTLLNL